MTAFTWVWRCVTCQAVASPVPSNRVCPKCSGRLSRSAKPAERQSGVGEAERINESENAEAMAWAEAKHRPGPLTYYPERAGVCGPCERWDFNRASHPNHEP